MSIDCRFQRLKKACLLLASVLLVGGLAGCGSTPEYMELESEELFAYGERALEVEEWSEAIGAFERFISTYPADPRIADARVKMGHAYAGNEEYLSAAAEYLRMLERYPGHARAPEAALGVCESYAELSPIPQRDQSYTRQAVRECERLERDYPQSPETERATEIRQQMFEKLAEKELETGRYYYRNRAYDSAMIYFEQVVEAYPRTPQAPEALLMLMRSYQRVEWEEEAEETRERILRLYPDSEAARLLSNPDADVDGNENVDGGAGGDARPAA